MSNYGEHVIGRRNYARLTQTAGTVITRLIEPMRNGFTRITGVHVKTSTTAHILTLMRPFNRCRFSADAAAAQAVVNIDVNPGTYTAQGTVATANNTMAANDYVVYEAADGTYVADIVSSISSLAVTLTGNVPTGGVKAGGLMWFFGLATDTNPNDNQANPRWNLDASTTTILGRGDGLTSIPDHKFLGIGHGLYQPLLLQIDNGTAASILQSVGVEYVRRAVA